MGHHVRPIEQIVDFSAEREYRRISQNERIVPLADFFWQDAEQETPPVDEPSRVPPDIPNNNRYSHESHSRDRDLSHCCTPF
jgi:hypothetical protein